MESLERIRTRAEARRRGSYLGDRLGKRLCELQHDQNIANADGATVRADLNNALGALFSLSSGTTAPTTTIAYMFWADTTANLLKQRNAANTGWIVRGTLTEAFVIARSSNTILAAADHAKTINCTTTFTQTLTAAATLGDGWFVFLRNDGTGVITIDPNSSETIDGAATIDIQPGEGCLVICNGSAFKTIGRNVTFARVGQVIDYAGTGVPSGFLACDGSAISRSTFATLFAEIGTTWGVGDGSTTFNVPDLRRRTTVGSGGSGTATLGNAVGNVGGEENHTLTNAEAPPHQHGIQDGAASPGVTGGGNGGYLNKNFGRGGDVTDSSGSGGAHNNIQPSAVLRKVIKF